MCRKYVWVARLIQYWGLRGGRHHFLWWATSFELHWSLTLGACLGGAILWRNDLFACINVLSLKISKDSMGFAVRPLDTWYVVFQHVITLREFGLSLFVFEVDLMPLPSPSERSGWCSKWSLERLYGPYRRSLTIRFWLTNYLWIIQVRLGLTISCNCGQPRSRWYGKLILPNFSWSRLQILKYLRLLVLYSRLLHASQMLVNAFLIDYIHLPFWLSILAFAFRWLVKPADDVFNTVFWSSGFNV